MQVALFVFLMEYTLIPIADLRLKYEFFVFDITSFLKEIFDLETFFYLSDLLSCLVALLTGQRSHYWRLKGKNNPVCKYSEWTDYVFQIILCLKIFLCHCE